MKSRRFAELLLFLLMTVSLSGQTASTADKWLGSWKLNLSKSRYQSTPPRGRVVKFEAVTGGMKAASDLVDVDGTVHIEFTAKYDGKDVVMNGPVLGQTIAVTKIDAYTFDTVQKSRGTTTSTTHNVVSRDGKTLTTTSTAIVPDGQKITNILVYDKQM